MRRYRTREIFIVLIIMSLITLSFNSCSSVQAGIYLVSIDSLNGETILQNQSNVRVFLADTIPSYEHYSMKVFERTGISFQFKRTKLVTHSFYMLISDSGEYYTLSFYGTKIAFYSKGAWVLNADSDVESYEQYAIGKNRWDVREIFLDNTIDVKGTLTNIINKMDNDIDKDKTFYYRDHIKKKPNMNNCNTALYETIVFD